MAKPPNTKRAVRIRDVRVLFAVACCLAGCDRSGIKDYPAHWTRARAIDPGGSACVDISGRYSDWCDDLLLGKSGSGDLYCRLSFNLFHGTGDENESSFRGSDLSTATHIIIDRSADPPSVTISATRCDGASDEVLRSDVLRPGKHGVACPMDGLALRKGEMVGVPLPLPSPWGYGRATRVFSTTTAGELVMRGDFWGVIAAWVAPILGSQEYIWAKWPRVDEASHCDAEESPPETVNE